jgi:hypothetical protein
MDSRITVRLPVHRQHLLHNLHSQFKMLILHLHHHIQHQFREPIKELRRQHHLSHPLRQVLLLLLRTHLVHNGCVRKLLQPMHSAALVHHKYRGRIVWDATDPNGILFSVNLTKKAYSPTQKNMAIMVNPDGTLGVDDLGTSSQVIIVTLNFMREHSEFDENYYHPDFPKGVQKYMRGLLKEDQILKKEIEKVLKT